MQWRDIPGWPKYQASTGGEIRNKKLKLVLSPALIQGALYVSVYDEIGNARMRPVHQLVLVSFRGPCPAGKRGCHLDTNRINNKLSNLGWRTPKEIAARKVKTVGYRHALKLRSARALALS